MTTVHNLKQQLHAALLKVHFRGSTRRTVPRRSFQRARFAIPLAVALFYLVPEAHQKHVISGAS
jgi:hypothetical protein